MSQDANQQSDTVQYEASVSEWFLRNYPNTTPGDMANYYRTVYSEVPLVTPDHDGYNLFHERMTGRTDAAFLAREQAARASQRPTRMPATPVSAKRAIFPIFALVLLMGLSALGLILVAES